MSDRPNVEYLFHRVTLGGGPVAPLAIIASIVAPAVILTTIWSTP